MRSVAAEKQLRNKTADLDREVARWESRAELAVRHGKDDLARDALAQKKRLTGERDRTERLRGCGFVRVHRGELVALAAIESLGADASGHVVRLRDGQVARVSRRLVSALKAQLGL